jgi:hypothetical protein
VFRDKGPKWWAALVLVALVVIAGGWLAVDRLVGGEGQPTAAPTSSETAEVPSTPSAPSADECDLPEPDGDGVLGEHAPEADSWQSAGYVSSTIPYPVSREFGPGVIRDGVRSCFQRSQAGALFAATNYVAQSAQFETLPSWMPSVLAGPGRDAAVQLVLDNESVLTGGDTTGFKTARNSWIAYKLLQWDEAEGRAMVDVVLDQLTSSDETYISTVFDLRWIDGDWRIWMPSADSMEVGSTITLQRLTGMGYRSWGEE